MLTCGGVCSILNLDRGPEAFYDTTAKTLKPQYGWYLDGLRRAGAVSVEIAELGDALIADLKTDRHDAARWSPHTEACRHDQRSDLY